MRKNQNKFIEKIIDEDVEMKSQINELDHQFEIAEQLKKDENDILSMME